MAGKRQPCIGDVWDYWEGGRYTVVGFVRQFGSEHEYVLCEDGEDRRIWPREAWDHLVPYRGADAPSGAMVRPFAFVRQGLAPPRRTSEA
jgi:hypothetical protein